MPQTPDYVRRARCPSPPVNKWSRRKIEHLASQLTGDRYPCVEQLCDWLARNHDSRFRVHRLRLSLGTQTFRMLPVEPHLASADIKGRTLHEALLRVVCWMAYDPKHLLE